ncbi:MAG: pilin [Candidatus Moranbacteria bacterium]|nr:pilin [Candidatus Moranbacteria bacterium]
MKIKNFAKTITHQSISGRNYKKISIRTISVLGGLGTAFATKADVALPTNVGLPGGTLTNIISNFTNWILGIFGFLAIISFVVSGIMYFLAAGDDKAQEKAKNQMTWSIMGVVIGLAGLIVVYAVDTFLRGTSGL